MIKKADLILSSYWVSCPRRKGYVGIVVFLFVLILLSSLCFGQTSQTGTKRVMIKGQWVDTPVFTIKGGTQTYYDAHPEEKAMDDARQGQKPFPNMYQLIDADIAGRMARDAKSFDDYGKKTYGLTSPPPLIDPTPPPEELFFHGKPGTTYTHVGGNTIGSDGSSYTTIGNTTIGSDGSTSIRMGNVTLGFGGTTSTLTGNTSINSNGITVIRSGSTSFGSNGTTCTKIGISTFCN